MRIRRRQESRGVTEAKAERADAEARLAESSDRLAEARRIVIEPLRRTRREMLEENHVAASLVRRIRREGGAQHGT